MEKLRATDFDQAAWDRELDELVYLANAQAFSNRIQNQMSQDRRNEKAEKKLFKLREKIIHDNPVIHTGYYMKNSQALLKSPIYDCLNVMPKPVVHHIHD